MDKEQVLDLLLFLKDKEYRVESEDKIIVWLDFMDIQDFTKIFGDAHFCEGDYEVALLENCIVFDLYDHIEGAGEETEYIVKKLKEMEDKHE